MKKHLLIGGTAIAFASWGSASAQTPEGGAQPLIQSAQPADTGNQVQLEEIVVTAQRRSEKLQNVPVSVTAITGAALSEAGIENLKDLRISIPGLTVTNSVGYATTRLRGVGSGALGPGLEAPIALYVDGVYQASSAGNLTDFVSVAQIEVLKGPQGTLFGRNATGGLIQINTRDPAHDPSLEATIGYGNYGTLKGSLYATTGFGPNLAADIAIQSSGASDGYGHNLASGRDTYRNYHNVTMRSKWLWTPGATTQVTLIGDYTTLKNSDVALRPFPGSSPTPPAGPAYGGSRYDLYGDVDPLIRTKTGGVSLKIDQDLGFASLLNIVSYRRTTSHIFFDADMSTVPYEGVFINQTEHNITEELQLRSNPGGPFTWTAGVFYFSGIARTDPLILTSRGGAGFPFGPLTEIDINAEQKSESVAGYAQGTLEVLPRTNLTLGVRYTYEKRSLLGGQDGFIGSVALGSLGTADDHKSFRKPSFRVALDHRFSDQVLGYVSFNTGTKSGGYNPLSITDPPYRPESLKAYEVGLKTDLLGRRLRANIAAFYYDYKDIQVQRVTNGTSGIANGAAAKIYGLDIDIDARVTSAFSLNAGLELLHDRFTDYPDAVLSDPSGTVPVTTGSAKGNRLPYAADVVFTLGGRYKVDDVAGGNLLFSVNYTHNSGFYMEPDNVSHQKPYDQLNASLRWSSEGDRYSMTVWGNNLTDSSIIAQFATNSFGSKVSTWQPPRTYGVTLGAKF